MRTLLLVSLSVASTALAQPAPLPTARVDAGRVFLDFPGAPGKEPVDVGCAPISAVVDQRLQVACSDGHVRTFELGDPPRLINDVQVDGEVRSLFLLGNQAWVEVAHYEAKPLRQASTTPPARASEPMPQPAAPVTAARPSAPPVVEAAKPEESIMGPQRQGDVFLSESIIRVMVPIGTLGVGALVDASITWRAEIPFAVRARISPLGGVTASLNQAGGVAAGSLDALFDGRFFAAGLGLGFGTVKDFAYQPNGSLRASDETGFLVSQHLRIGALEGLNFTAQTQLVATRLSGFTIYGGEGLLQIPVRRDWQLRLRGGGSRAPFGFGELGMRIGIGGEEKPRLFLTPSVGAIFLNSFIGPSVGLGVDYRL